MSSRFQPNSNIKQNNTHISSKMREIFVGGLPSHTTESMLRSYFEYFGKILKCKPQTWKSGAQRCRGFGIISCSNERTYNLILSENQHCFEGRRIECKPCLPRNQLQKYNKDLIQRKVFVRNLSASIKNSDLFSIFSCKGDIEMAYVVDGKRIGFVTFKTAKGRNQALSQSFFEFKGKRIVCEEYNSNGFEEKKRANPGDYSQSQNKSHKKYKKRVQHTKTRRYPKVKDEIKRNVNTHHAVSPQLNHSKNVRRLRKFNELSPVLKASKGIRAGANHQAFYCKSKALPSTNPEDFYSHTTPCHSLWHELFEKSHLFKIQNPNVDNYRFNTARKTATKHSSSQF